MNNQVELIIFDIGGTLIDRGCKLAFDCLVDACLDVTGNYEEDKELFEDLALENMGISKRPHLATMLDEAGYSATNTLVTSAYDRFLELIGERISKEWPGEC